MTPESPTPPPADQPPNDTSGIKIHNWSDAKDPIGDDTELVRYMKLETFLLMLNSRVFIPTLGCLAATDRLESRIPQRFHSHNYPEAMKQVVKDHEEWLEQIATGKQMPTDSDYPTDQKLRFLTETWLYELGQRRLVWCWNRWTYRTARNVAILWPARRGNPQHRGPHPARLSTSWSGWLRFPG